MPWLAVLHVTRIVHVCLPASACRRLISSGHRIVKPSACTYDVFWTWHAVAVVGQLFGVHIRESALMVLFLVSIVPNIVVKLRMGLVYLQV